MHKFTAQPTRHLAELWGCAVVGQEHAVFKKYINKVQTSSLEIVLEVETGLFLL